MLCCRCVLGDLTLDESHYVTAWEKSNHRSTRAQRSLATSAHRKQEYERSAGHWELALAVNPLHPTGWFTLGHCYLKLERFDQAVRAFTRTVMLEPDNGEAWNNIGAVLMHLGKRREAFNALAEVRSPANPLAGGLVTASARTLRTRSSCRR